MSHYILFNPLAGHGDCDEKLTKLKSFLDGECVECDMTKLDGITDLVAKLERDDDIIISGGDGTLNRFINAVDCDAIENDVWYYGSGSGNDFLHDIGGKIGDAPIKINEYLKNLPEVEIKDDKKRCLNGVGLGVDGAVCRGIEEFKAKTNKKKANYTNISLDQLLCKYKRPTGRVTVDGVTYIGAHIQGLGCSLFKFE